MTSVSAVIITLGGLLLTGVFATLQMALLHAARTTLGAIATAKGDERAQRRVDLIVNDIEAHALAQGLLAGLCTLLTALGFVALVAGPDPSRVGVALGLLTAVPFLWAAGVALPASLGEHAGEPLVFSASTLVRAVRIAMSPVIAVASSLDELVRRTASSTTTEAEAIEADLLSVVEEGQQEGQFDEQERDMIESVVRLRTTCAEEVMTPRTEIDALEYTDDLPAIKAFIREAQHSRIPVYEENLDHVVGILYAKDLLHYLAEHGDEPERFELRALLRPAAFTPEARSVREVLRELLDRRTHVTLVADEYGGTAGLVTVEDIIEEVFGDILDEYESEEEDSPSIDVDEDAGTASVDARAHIDDLNDALEPLGVSLPEDDDYDTLGGCVMAALGRIPEPGEQLRIGRVGIEVTDAEPTRVLRVTLRVLDAEEDDADDNAAGEAPADSPEMADAADRPAS